jgi:hypothetical protein
MIDTLLPLIKKFMPFAQKRMGFNKPPRLFLKNDDSNASDPLGRTAYYDPNKKSVTIYVTGRHPKDVMRSLSHELVHHKQNCRGDFDSVGEMGEGYAQNDEHLREMEREAYETGNMCFRDWEDSLKSTIYYEHLQKGENKMSLKDWKNKEVKSLLSEAWGFKMDLSKLNESADEKKEKYPGLNPYDDRGAHDNRNRDADGKPIGKNVDAFGRVVKDDDEPETGQVKEGDEIDRKATDARKTPWFDRTDKQHDASTAKHKKDNPGGIPKGTDYDPETEKPKRYKGSSDRMRDRLEEDDGDVTDELEEGCGDDDDLSEDSGAEEGDHYRDNTMHDDDHIKAIEHHLDALKHDKNYDDDHIDERASMSDASPKAPGRRVTKPNGERVTTEATAAASAELQKEILEVLRKHF